MVFADGRNGGFCGEGDMAFLCLAAQILSGTVGLTKPFFYVTITKADFPLLLKTGSAYLDPNRPVFSLRSSDSINKASKSRWACVLRKLVAQRRGKLAAICPLMLFPHPLQNRVPRGERAPVALWCEPTEPTGETAGRRWRPFSAVLSCRFGRCWACATGTQHPSRQARIESFTVPKLLHFSYPVGSVPTVSVCFIIKKSSIRGRCSACFRFHKLNPSVIPFNRWVSFFT